MDQYHFFADLFDTYQSLPDWLKLAWLIVPGLVVLGGLLIWRWPKGYMKRRFKNYQLVFSVFVDKQGVVRLYSADDVFTPIARVETPEIEDGHEEKMPDSRH